jgi:aminoglycoside phosphotransferase (APT) family kinase protein
MDRRGAWHRFALRGFDDRDRLATDPWYVPEHELLVLAALEGRCVRAPTVVAEDLRAERCDAPTLLTTWLPGAPYDPRRLAHGATRAFFQLSEELAAIHAVPVFPATRRGTPAYEPYRAGSGGVRAPAVEPAPVPWERAVAIASGPAPDTPAGFIHRDHHLANTLWRRGRLTGVVNWTTGRRGPFGMTSRGCG